MICRWSGFGGIHGDITPIKEDPRLCHRASGLSVKVIVLIMTQIAPQVFECEGFSISIVMAIGNTTCNQWA